MTTAAVEHVHREMPGFQAFREFCGRHDTCGPNAAVEVLAALDKAHWSASCASMNPLVDRMLANGRLRSGGCTMDSLVKQIREEGYLVEWDPWMEWKPQLDLALLHQLLKDRSGNVGIILQVGQAHNLPDNEAGVFSHFVAIGGIDSFSGYLIGNGDIPTWRYHGAEWIGWNHIVEANPTSVCLVALHPSPPPVLTVADKLKAMGYTDSHDFDPNAFDGILTAKNGVTIVRGNRQKIVSGAYIPPADQAWYGVEMSDGTVSCQIGTIDTLEWSQPTGVTVHPTLSSGKVLAHAQVLLQRPTATPHMTQCEAFVAEFKQKASDL